MNSYALETSLNLLAQRLLNRALTCSTAESCTGGLLSGVLTSMPGSSRWFNGGVIAYSNDVKIRLLEVSPETLAQYGAVSAEVVCQMAAGACKALHTQTAMALSGVAGPDGGTPDKPVGTVFLGIAVPGVVQAFDYCFPGNRDDVRRAAVQAAISRMLALLKTDNA